MFRLGTEMPQVTGNSGAGADNATVVGMGHSGSPREGPMLSDHYTGAGSSSES